MKKVELEQVQHDVKIGDVCGNIQPNVTEDSIFYSEGKAIGFYMNSLPQNMYFALTGEELTIK